MITINKLTYSVGARKILDNISFNVEDEENVALVGPNGAGKSTLVKMLVRELSPNEGEIIISKSIKDLGYMPQQIDDLGELPNKSVLDFMLSGRRLDTISSLLEKKLEEMRKPELSIEESEKLASQYSDCLEEFQKRGGYAAESELLEILTGMNLSEINLDQNVRTLSGGQKTKLAFGRVLFSRPALMILDEPTNHLDEETLDWVVRYLKGFKGTLIMVSHAPSILDEIVEKIVYLNGNGTCATFKGNFSDFVQKKSELDQAQTRLHAKQQKEAERLEIFIKRWRGSTRKKVAQVRDREKKIERLKKKMVEAPISQASILLDFPVKIDPISHVLDVQEVNKSFEGRKVLDNISFSLYRGERMAIVGPNGAGKTTLLKMVAGILKPDKGSIILGDRVDIGYYAQEHEFLDPDKNLLEELMAISDLSQTHLRSILAHFLFPGNKVFTKISSLSLGERSRLALAKLVVVGHNLLVLDEPTNHLDFVAREKVKEALSKYSGTILIVTHDREFIRGIGAEKVLLLPENRFGYLEQIIRE